MLFSAFWRILKVFSLKTVKRSFLSKKICVKHDLCSRIIIAAAMGCRFRRDKCLSCLTHFFFFFFENIEDSSKKKTIFKNGNFIRKRSEKFWRSIFDNFNKTIEIGFCRVAIGAYSHPHITENCPQQLKMSLTHLLSLQQRPACIERAVVLLCYL